MHFLYTATTEPSVQSSPPPGGQFPHGGVDPGHLSPGSYERNLAAVEAEAREFVLSRLFPATVYGGDNLPRFAVQTDEDRLAHSLTQHETMGLQFLGHIRAEALLRFPEHHGLPSMEELTLHFGSSVHVRIDAAHALARAFHRWWSGDYEGAGYTALPRIEEFARELLLRLDAPLYRLQRERAPGQYPGLGVLLDELQQRGLPVDMHRFMYTLLVNPIGWNLRNEMSHGFVRNVDLVLAAMILQCATFLALPLLSGQADENSSEEPDDPSVPD